MHVIQTHTRYHPHVDGVGSTIRSVARHLRDRGHEVTVLCSRIDDERPREERVEGVRVVRVPTAGRIGDTDIAVQFPRVLASLADGADVIHAHLPTPWTADVSALVGRWTATPTVLTYHNDIVGRGLASVLARGYNATALRLTLGLVDAVLITRPGYLDESAHLSPFADKVRVVQNGVDVDRFRPRDVAAVDVDCLDADPDRPVAFFLSLLDDSHTYKGLDTLLAATAVLDRHDGATPLLVVGGDGERRARYERRVAALGLTDHVTFTGRVPDADLPALYSLADVFVLPSRSSTQEGFGLVLLEALACGTPVVTTPVVGIADVVASEDVGALVPVDEPERLAGAIRRYLAHDAPVDAARMRELCREEFSWASSVDDLLDVYRDVTPG